MEGGDEFFMDGIPEENEWGDFDAVPTHSAPAIPQETETPPQSHSPPQPQQPPQQRVQHTPPPGLGSGSGSGASQGLTPVHFNLGVGDCETEKSQFKFRVGEWKKSGEGMSAYVLFTIRCRTTAQGWTKIEITTERRYNEFCWLFKQLTKENPYCIVPPLPEKTSLLNSKFDDDFLRQRGKELCRFMERVGAHPTLSQSSALKTFMTTNPLPESTQAPAKETPAPAPQSSSSSSGGWFSFLSNTVSNITTTSTTTKPVEVDVFFENKARYYKDLETTILSLADMSANYVANYRDRVFRANTFVDVCQRLSLAEGNSNTAGGGDVKVGNSYLHLMNVGTQRAIFDTQLGDSLRDTWESDLRDAQRQFQQVEALLQYRLDLLGEYQNSSSVLTQKRDKFAKLSVGHPEYEKTQREVDDAQRSDDEARKKFSDASSSCKRELELFERKRIVEIRNLISEFSKMHLEHVVMEEDLWKGVLNHL